MFKELNDLIKENRISKKPILKVLKKYARTITIYDEMAVCNVLRDEGKYVQESYREEFLKMYVDGFIIKLKEMKEDKTPYKNKVDSKDFEENLKTVKAQYNRIVNEEKRSDKFPLIYSMISIYTTFITEEPVHKEGSVFPGGLKVEYIDGTYYCPVKDNQKDNPNAICKVCIAEQTIGI